MRKRWHMKLDQSGPAECSASVKDCPNGEFGHHENPYDVSLAYEHKIRTGQVPGLTIIRTLRREEIVEQGSELRSDLATAKNDEEYMLSIATYLHPLDAQTQNELLSKHSGNSKLDREVRSKIAEMSESSNVLDRLAESEDSYEVLFEVMGNRQSSDDNLRDIYSKHKDSIPGLADQVMLAAEIKQRSREEDARADRSFLRNDQERKKKEAFKRAIEQKRAIPQGPLAHHPLAIGEAEAITFSFARNTKSLGAPTLDKSFGQDIEPAGRYMTEDSTGTQLLDGWERGEVRFTKPLRVDFGGNYGASDNWKNALSAHYGGKTGEQLSQAIRNDGYDAIVTEDHNGSREVVDLTMYNDTTKRSDRREEKRSIGTIISEGERFTREAVSILENAHRRAMNIAFDAQKDPKHSDTYGKAAEELLNAQATKSARMGGINGKPFTDRVGLKGAHPATRAIIKKALLIEMKERGFTGYVNETQGAVSVSPMSPDEHEFLSKSVTMDLN